MAINVKQSFFELPLWFDVPSLITDMAMGYIIIVVAVLLSHILGILWV